jgi:hypothetical protein
MNHAMLIRMLALLLLSGLVAPAAYADWDNLDHAQPGGTVLRKGVLITNSPLGHAGVYLGSEGDHGLVQPIIQANGDTPSSYVSTEHFLDGNDFWGNYRAPSVGSATLRWRDEVMRYAKDTTAKAYVFFCLYRYDGDSACLFAKPEPDGVPESFRCDGVAEWVNEKTNQSYDGLAEPSRQHGFSSDNLTATPPSNIAFSGEKEVLPTLHVASVAATEDGYAAGDPITVINRVENQGGGPVRAYKASFVLLPQSAGGAWGPDQIPLQSFDRGVIDYNLAQNQTTNLRLPDDLASGEYYLGLATSYELNGATFEWAGVAEDTIVVSTQQQRRECLFDWAEASYPALFSPAGAETAFFSPYHYRFYSGTNAYLGVSDQDGHVYYLSPGGVLLDVGELYVWRDLAGCP